MTLEERQRIARLMRLDYPTPASVRRTPLMDRIRARTLASAGMHILDTDTPPAPLDPARYGPCSLADAASWNGR